MVIPMPAPEAVNEYDEEPGAWFISLSHLLELKIAVYLKKLAEDGIEIAVKDLADVVSLLEINLHAIDEVFIEKLRVEVREEFIRIYHKVKKRTPSRPYEGLNPRYI